MRILLVEDDRHLRGFLADSLISEHFSVDAIDHGEKASYLARVNDYDLILLDNILPGKTGATICKEIRALGKGTPILMMTVQSEVAQKVAMLDLGADDYITKPFALDEMLARIRALLRRPQEIVTKQLTVGDIVLDPARGIVTRGEKELYLTRKEFELLEYLMRSEGRVVSRGMILEHVWDMNADPFSNTIETHMMNLRRKLESGSGRKLIHTVTGRGYRLEAR
jgi:DNA-binding response OmpR family regulator